MSHMFAEVDVQDILWKKMKIVRKKMVLHFLLQEVDLKTSALLEFSGLGGRRGTPFSYPSLLLR